MRPLSLPQLRAPHGTSLRMNIERPLIRMLHCLFLMRNAPHAGSVYRPVDAALGEGEGL
jgi:hypothetical protein